jgi:signal transduction histidine kinase
VVEDDAPIRESLTELLESEGYDVHGCDNGAVALERLHAAAAPDVIILDLRMPVMDGWQFRAKQRAEASLASIPVVAISADDSPQARAVHADAYLHKPFQTKQLLATVAGIIGESQRRQLEARLEQAERLAAVGQLAAGVGHEINNPLTYVTLNVRHLVERMEAADPGQWPGALGQPDLLVVMRETVDGLERIRKIVEGLQSLARKDDGLAPVDVQHLLDSALVMADHQVRPRARVIKAYGGVPAVTGHAGRLTQLFLNLIVNAAQAMDQGKSQANRLTVTTVTEGAWVRIEIADTGTGVPPELLPRIFDPFFTTKPVGAGTGLGLAISRQIVVDHGGDIEVRGGVGGGTTMRIRLPLHPGAPAAAVMPSTPAVAAQRARVLVIDDETLVAKAIGRILRRDHQVVVVHDVKAACARLTSGERFDAILCDLTMPEAGGAEFHAYLQAQAADLVPRLAFITGGALTAEARRFLAERSTTPVLHKPFEAEELCALVATLVARQPPPKFPRSD